MFWVESLESLVCMHTCHEAGGGGMMGRKCFFVGHKRGQKPGLCKGFDDDFMNPFKMRRQYGLLLLLLTAHMLRIIMASSTASYIAHFTCY